MKQICSIIIGCCITCVVSAQEFGTMSDECSRKLEEAGHFYIDGQFEDCITNLNLILKNCELSRSETDDVYELLANAQIMLDKPKEADSAVFKMLKMNPHYQLKEEYNLPAYNQLVRKFSVFPRLSIGVRNAYNSIHYTKTKTFSVLDDLDYDEPYNHKGFSIFYYGWAEFAFDKLISINADLIFFWTTYNRRFVKDPGFNLYYSEINNFVEIPVYLKRYFHIPKYRNILPYVALGAGWLRMTGAYADVSIAYTKNDNLLTGHSYDYVGYSNNIDVITMRNRNLFELIEGAGVGYQYRNFRFFFDLRYYAGLKSFTNEAARFGNDDLRETYFYIDNSVRLNQFEIGISISYTLLNSIVKKN